MPRESKKPKKKEFVPSAAGVDKVARVVKLNDITLIGGQSERRITDDIPDDCEIQTHVTQKLLKEKGKKSVFYVLFSLGVRGVRLKENEEPEIFFTITAQYRLSYELKEPKGIVTSDLQSFGEVNSIIHVWPFWREYVHSLTSRMGLAVVTLGVRPPRIGLAKLIEQENKK